MEDAHVCETDFQLKNWSFFGVFDGHAGPKVAEYCSKNLLGNIMQCYETLSDETDEQEKVKSAIRKGFLKMDTQLRDQAPWSTGEDHSGTTAICVMISPTHIYWPTAATHAVSSVAQTHWSLHDRPQAIQRHGEGPYREGRGHRHDAESQRHSRCLKGSGRL